MTTIPPIAIVRPEGAAVVNLQLFEENGAMCLGIRRMAGRTAAGPKRVVAAFREELSRLEEIARNSGCTEVRLCGRDWSRIVGPLGYVPYDGVPNGLRKVL